MHVGRRRRSIGAQRALGWGTRARADLDAHLAELVDRVTRRLRAADRVGRIVVLRLRFDDLSRATRSHTLTRATDHTETILATTRELLASVEPVIDQRGLTLIGVAVANLDDNDAVQLALPFTRTSGGALDAAVDDVRDRFGSGAVGRASMVSRGAGI